MSTRLWARGTNTTYTYHNCGDLSDVTYTGTGTPSVTQTYTRRGQLGKVARDGISTSSLILDDAGNLLSESFTAGPLSGITLTNRYDSLLRRTNVAILNFQFSIPATPTTPPRAWPP